jgi:hypothetical protein
MKNRIAFPALALLILAVPAISQEFAYVGAQKCQICHKSETQGRQYPIWEASKHSKSLEALTSPKAAEVAKTMGVDNPADDPRCLKCHSPLSAQAPDIKSGGVSCEVCHGPGSEYKKLSVMKDKAAAVKSGLILYSGPEAIKAQCLKCHESSHCASFDFAAAWEKIKHSVPAK